MDRRTFLARAGLVATWAGIPITISCGSDDSTSPPVDNGDIVGNVAPASGHTHSGAVVTAAEVTAGSAVTLTLSTTSGHNHMVNLTAQQVTDIGASTNVIQNSTTDSAHFHVVTFN